jgi:GNAT superfamily N-acetyltransferase
LTGIRIVEARREHVRTIVDLWVDLAEYHRSLGAPVGPQAPPEHLAEFLEGQIEASESLVVAALSGVEVVGFGLCFVAVYPPAFRTDDRGFISQLVVGEGYRRHGVGAAMVAFIREWIRARGIARIEIRVSPLNAGGRRFWEKQGFSEYEAVMFLEER